MIGKHAGPVVWEPDAAVATVVASLRALGTDRVRGNLFASPMGTDEWVAANLIERLIDANDSLRGELADEFKRRAEAMEQENT